MKSIIKAQKRHSLDGTTLATQTRTLSCWEWNAKTCVKRWNSHRHVLWLPVYSLSDPTITSNNSIFVTFSRTICLIYFSYKHSVRHLFTISKIKVNLKKSFFRIFNSTTASHLQALFFTNGNSNCAKKKKIQNRNYLLFRLALALRVVLDQFLNINR